MKTHDFMFQFSYMENLGLGTCWVSKQGALGSNSSICRQSLRCVRSGIWYSSSLTVLIEAMELDSTWYQSPDGLTLRAKLIFKPWIPWFRWIPFSCSDLTRTSTQSRCCQPSTNMIFHVPLNHMAATHWEVWPSQSWTHQAVIGATQLEGL